MQKGSESFFPFSFHLPRRAQHFLPFPSLTTLPPSFSPLDLASFSRSWESLCHCIFKDLRNLNLRQRESSFGSYLPHLLARAHLDLLLLLPLSLPNSSPLPPAPPAPPPATISSSSAPSKPERRPNARPTPPPLSRRRRSPSPLPSRESSRRRFDEPTPEEEAIHREFLQRQTGSSSSRRRSGESSKDGEKDREKRKAVEREVEFLRRRPSSFAPEEPKKPTALEIPIGLHRHLLVTPTYGKDVVIDICNLVINVSLSPSSIWVEEPAVD